MKRRTDTEDFYEDIIRLPHHVSETHPRMSIYDRAAQFSPFAALTGHGYAIRETGRLTERRIELDENSRELLDEKMLQVVSRIREHPAVAVTYFVPDGKKDGGSYVTVSGRVKKIDEYDRAVVLMDGMRIPAEEILDIQCGAAVFSGQEDEPS